MSVEDEYGVVTLISVRTFYPSFTNPLYTILLSTLGPYKPRNWSNIYCPKLSKNNLLKLRSKIVR
jgi:hypothetical protein